MYIGHTFHRNDFMKVKMVLFGWQLVQTGCISLTMIFV